MFYVRTMIEWNLDPVAFSLGPFAPRWYGIFFAMAFWLSYQVMQRIFAAEKKVAKDLDRLTIYMVIGTILGARLGHVVFYEPEIFLSDPLEVFAVWHGGLASHGGALGIITGLWLFHRNSSSFSMVWLLDRLAIVSALSGMCIRIGNLFNSEIIGRPTDVAWAFWFKRIDALPIYRHPTQIYEALVCLALFLLTWYLYNKGLALRKPGFLIGLFLVLLFTARFFIEFVKERQVDFESTMALDMGQLLSIPFVIAGVVFLVYSRRTSSRLA